MQRNKLKIRLSKEDAINSMKKYRQKCRIFLQDAWQNSKDFMQSNTDEKDSPSGKCRKAFFASLIYNFFAINLFIMSFFKNWEVFDTHLSTTLLILGIATTIICLYAGGRIYAMEQSGDYTTTEGIVTKARRFNPLGAWKIEVLVGEDEHREFYLDSDVKVKKYRKYVFYYYKRDEDYVVTNVKYLANCKKQMKKKFADRILDDEDE